MDDIIIKISPVEYMRMKAAVIDSDHEGALELVRELLRRTDMSLNSGLKSHLDA